ncbi:MAG TPA: hypothetical protein DEF51_01120 [Myxococcales bacterium]|nr:hypothetical protein [Myxococcales bacterium]
MPEGNPAKSERDRRRWAVVLGIVAALGWLGLAALADGYFAHGWSARWYWTDADGERHLVDRTVEHRTTFPNVHRPIARYVQGWPFERLARPEDLPEIDAELRARLEVPDGPARYLSLRARSEATLRVDGQTLDGDAAGALPLAPGVHDVVVRWRGRALPYPARGRPDPRSAFLELTWDTRPGPGTTVPHDALTPASEAWPTSRLALWWAAGLGALFWGLGFFFAMRAPRARARWRRFGLLATVAVALLGTAYRAWDYDVVPEFRDNADELFATWNGWSILEDGTTRGWTIWPAAYGGTVSVEEARYFGERRPVISPYFEQPAFFHVIVGVAAHLGGAEHWLDAKLKHTRLVPMGLNVIAIFLLVAVGRRLFGPGPGPWLGALLYATLPIIALQTRVVKEEDLLVVLSLAMMLFFLRWQEHRKTRDLVLASVCAGLSTCTKIPAVVWVPALVMLVAAEKGETRRAVLSAAIAVGISSLLLVFALVVDWEVFVMTTAKQGSRPTHWNLFPRFLDAILINHDLVGRGWSLFLWVAYGASVWSRGFKNAAVYTVPMIAYLVAIGLGSGNHTFGWYMIPVYPFLCLGTGDFLERLLRRPTFFGGGIFVTLFVMYSMNFTVPVEWAKQPEAWPGLRRDITLFLLLSLSPYALAQVWRDNRFFVKLARLWTVVGLAMVVWISADFIIHYDRSIETYFNFDRDMYFHR